jgi:hypothetical protein
MEKQKRHQDKKGEYSVVIRLIRRADQRKVAFRKAGQSTDLGIIQFICGLFEANERLPRPQKMTDATMKAAIIAEYPNSPSSAKLKSGKRHLGYWRTLYNMGHWSQRPRGTPRIPPAVRSKRYAEDGTVADPRGRSQKELRKIPRLRAMEKKRKERRREAQRARRKRKKEEQKEVQEHQKKFYSMAHQLYFKEVQDWLEKIKQEERHGG